MDGVDINMSYTNLIIIPLAKSDDYIDLKLHLTVTDLPGTRKEYADELRRLSKEATGNNYCSIKRFLHLLSNLIK